MTGLKKTVTSDWYEHSSHTPSGCVVIEVDIGDGEANDVSAILSSVVVIVGPTCISNGSNICSYSSGKGSNTSMIIECLLRQMCIATNSCGPINVSLSLSLCSSNSSSSISRISIMCTCQTVSHGPCSIYIISYHTYCKYIIPMKVQTLGY